MRIHRLLLVIIVLGAAGGGYLLLRAPSAPLHVKLSPIALPSAPAPAPTPTPQSEMPKRPSVAVMAQHSCVMIRTQARLAPNNVGPVTVQPVPKSAPPATRQAQAELHRLLRQLPTEGAGVIVLPGDIILTSARLVRGQHNVTLYSARYPNGVPGAVVSVNDEVGLAWVQTDQILGEPILWPAMSVQTGETLLFANTRQIQKKPSLPNTVVTNIAKGTVVATDLQSEEAPAMRLVQVEVSNYPYVEGGPVFNIRGDLVGVVMEWPVFTMPIVLPHDVPLTKETTILPRTIFVIPVTGEPQLKMLGGCGSLRLR